ncbi:helix-turn-helix domain-containing protein [Bifidobacterium vansinderenii]|uniref:HTH cro/C1-type domain-containing protein n=1 Tax=Bifidobacterium vansinderenii TaxID=1984871 RepID=A0A229VYU6_9BIFI|nr:helix-turn-helix transcriptional regulator [Bifidobacterium vansinderenii]OXN00799.1 hypothetical protein Tam10B_0754 [Bifidobacterium vansinderenii]
MTLTHQASKPAKQSEPSDAAEGVQATPTAATPTLTVEHNMPPRSSNAGDDAILDVVARLANERDWTRDDLADHSGIHPELLDRILDANCSVNIEDMDRFAKAFNMPFAEFVAECEREPIPEYRPGRLEEWTDGRPDDMDNSYTLLYTGKAPLFGLGFVASIATDGRDDQLIDFTLETDDIQVTSPDDLERLAGNVMGLHSWLLDMASVVRTIRRRYPGARIQQPTMSTTGAE